MEANCSFLVTDPKGETLRAVAPLLLQKGYVIKVFDLIDPARSDSFNAFAYIKDDKDVMKLVNNFIKNTTPKGAQQNDPFWERSRDRVGYGSHFVLDPRSTAGGAEF